MHESEQPQSQWHWAYCSLYEDRELWARAWACETTMDSVEDDRASDDLGTHVRSVVSCVSIHSSLLRNRMRSGMTKRQRSTLVPCTRCISPTPGPSRPSRPSSHPLRQLKQRVTCHHSRRSPSLLLILHPTLLFAKPVRRKVPVSTRAVPPVMAKKLFPFEHSHVLLTPLLPH